MPPLSKTGSNLYKGSFFVSLFVFFVRCFICSRKEVACTAFRITSSAVHKSSICKAGFESDVPLTLSRRILIYFLQFATAVLALYQSANLCKRVVKFGTVSFVDAARTRFTSGSFSLMVTDGLSVGRSAF